MFSGRAPPPTRKQGQHQAGNKLGLPAASPDRSRPSGRRAQHRRGPTACFRRASPAPSRDCRAREGGRRGRIVPQKHTDFLLCMENPNNRRPELRAWAAVSAHCLSGASSRRSGCRAERGRRAGLRRACGAESSRLSPATGLLSVVTAASSPPHGGGGTPPWSLRSLCPSPCPPHPAPYPRLSGPSDQTGSTRTSWSPLGGVGISMTLGTGGR